MFNCSIPQQELVTVQLTKETVGFLQELARRIATQNNRATARPYFFVIQKRRWRVAHEDYHSGETRQAWVDFSGDPDTYHSKEDWLQHCRDYQMTPEEAEAGWEKLEEFTEEAYVEEENCFLTFEAYKEHLEVNGHNLRGEHWSYLKHAFRNREMDSLFRAIAEFA